MKHMKVSPAEKKKTFQLLGKKKRFPFDMYKKKIESLKIPPPPPHHFSNGPPLSCRLLANEKADNEYNV